MKKTFNAKLKRLGSTPGNNAGELGWNVVDVPFDVKKAFGKAGTVPVSGTVNGFAFRTSVFPRKEGKHFLLVNKRMRNGAGGVALGDTVEVTIEFDEVKRTVDIHPLLTKALEDDEELLEYYNSFSYSMRKYFTDNIEQVKSPAIAQKRAEQLAEILVEMRDGELDPPPYLKAEFARNPEAKVGWEKMPPSHRRSHLWGVAYYKTPEARQKRLDKAIAMMVEYADKKPKKLKEE